MGQIINLNIGKAGIRIGQQFLSQIADQHFKDENEKKGKSHVFFNEMQTRQQSRSIFMDMNSKAIESLNLNKKSHIIKEKNIFKGSGEFSDLFATGLYLDGCVIAQKSLQIIRKQVEYCDRLSGFLLLTSLSGGAGGGMSAFMLSKLRQSYCYNIVQPHMLIPDIENFCSPIQIYNSVFAFNYCLQWADLCILAQNQACQERLKSEGILRPTIQQINKVLAEQLCQTTANYRFGGHLNASQRKVCTNIVLFPRMKFCISSFSKKNNKLSHLQNTLNPKNYSKSKFFESINGYRSIYTMQVNCRDNFAYEEQIDSRVKNWAKNCNINFCEWLPNTIHQSIIDQVKVDPSSSILINSKQIVNTLMKIHNLFTLIYGRRSFMYHYLNCGMDEMEFVEAQSNLNDMISQYNPTSGYYEEEEDFGSEQPQ